jgi:hypothetical protein
MRFSRLLAALVVTAVSLVTVPASQAVQWHRANPLPLCNYIQRCWGIGWSDGYHAYGSRTSWIKPWHHRHQGHVYPTQSWNSYSVPMMHDETIQPLQEPPRPTPATEVLHPIKPGSIFP